MQQVRKVLVLALTRERVVGEADNECPALCASIRKYYAAVAYHIFCTYVRGVSVKNQQISLRTGVQKQFFSDNHSLLE